MADKLFLTRDDFPSYKDISEHIDEDRITEAVLEAQISDLVAFIGEPLYKRLQDDYTVPNTWVDPNLQALFEGTEYTPQGGQYEVIYHGLRPMLVYFAYARLLTNIQLNVTRTGPVTYTTDQTEATVQAQIKTKVIDSRAMATRYMDEAKKFLQTKRSVFPEWRDPHEGNLAFKFLKL